MFSISVDSGTTTGGSVIGCTSASAKAASASLNRESTSVVAPAQGSISSSVVIGEVLDALVGLGCVGLIGCGSSLGVGSDNGEIVIEESTTGVVVVGVTIPLTPSFNSRLSCFFV